MGMYTGIRFTAKLNEFGARVIKDLHSEWAQLGFSAWGRVAEKYPDFKGWARVGRCDFIPFGAVCYMPNEWGEGESLLEEATWRVTCSLKNYAGEIDTFLASVLPKIIGLPCSVEVLYEEDKQSRIVHILPKTEDGK